MKKITFFFSLILSIYLLQSFNKRSGGNTGLTNSPRTSVWKMGVALYSFRANSFSDALTKTVESGAKYIQGISFYGNMGPAFKDSSMGHLDKDGIKLMGQMLKEKGLVMKSMYVSDAKTLDDWKRYFDMATALKLEFLVCEPAKDQWDLVDSLAGLYKIKIAIHEHGQGLSKYWHPDSVLAAIKGHKNFGACADLGHWARSGLDNVECLKKLAGHIFDIHLKDVDQLNKLDAKDKKVGTGIIDFPGVVKELKRQKYKGFINVESENDSNDNVPDVKEAIEYINKLAAKD